MSGDTLRGRFALGLSKRMLDHVVDPGIDPIPEQGTKLLDRRGHVWEVAGNGIRLLNPQHGERFWEWFSPHAEYIGPLLNPSTITPTRGRRA